MNTEVYDRLVIAVCTAYDQGLSVTEIREAVDTAIQHRWDGEPAGKEGEERSEQPLTIGARDRYRELVKQIGMGFHPDTRGNNYTSLPDGIEPADVDRTIREAIEAGVDVYLEAIEILMPSDTRVQLVPTVGMKVRTKREVIRYPHFICPAGWVGEVVEGPDNGIAVSMLQHLHGAEDWDNEIIWSDGDEDHFWDDMEVIPND